MKKAIALFLALSMVFAIVACGDSNKPSESASTPTESGSEPADTGAPADPGSEADAPPADAGKPYPNANADGSINLDTIAHYDNDYDYTQNTKFKVAYLAQDGGPLYQQSAAAYEHWAPIFNCEWAGFLSSNGDADMFMTNLQNLIDQGVKGFIVDPDATIFPAVIQMIENSDGVAWMSQMAPPRDGEEGDNTPIGGNLTNPYVGFDNFDAGAQQVYKLVEWKNENLPDVPWDQIGCVSMEFSTSPPLHERVIGAERAWRAETGTGDNNFFVADCVSGGINLQSGIDAIGPVISTHSEFKNWLIVGLIDDWALAAASVIDSQGLTDGSCVVTFGGSGLQMQWDAGQQDSFRYALFTAQNLYAEPILGAVYAYLNGWATPDSIWPSWVKWDDHGTGDHTYSQLRLPTVWLTYDNYKHYLEWTDMYAHAEAYPYSQDGIGLDAYSPFVDEVPADFKAP
jgi:ABC-type sugar transport system substrate-binding protein